MVKIPLLSRYMATKAWFLTLRARSTFIVVNVNKDKSREYLNDESLIKP